MWPYPGQLFLLPDLLLPCTPCALCSNLVDDQRRDKTEIRCKRRNGRGLQLTALRTLREEEGEVGDGAVLAANQVRCRGTPACDKDVEAGRKERRKKEQKEKTDGNGSTTKVMMSRLSRERPQLGLQAVLTVCDGSWVRMQAESHRDPRHGLVRLQSFRAKCRHAKSHGMRQH